MVIKYLWGFGAALFILLGSVHFVYTFFTDKFFARNKTVVADMKSSSLILTKNTSMWKAWIGFNASHSIGMLFFGFINLFLLTKHYDTFLTDHFYCIINIFVASFYVWLGKKYWFNVPFIGASITMICYLLSYILILI